MKSATQIHVKEPCEQNFENFEKTDHGGFCGSCQMEVIDFTSMTDEQLLTYFDSNPNKICGRFRKNQLVEDQNSIPSKLWNTQISKRIGTWGISLMTLFFAPTLLGQEIANNTVTQNTSLQTSLNLGLQPINAIEEYTVKGIVLDEDNLPLAGVNVILKGTTEGIVTDLNGKFEFPRKLNVDDTLIFSYIGYDSKEYTIKESDVETIEITITFDLSDIELMGEVVVGGAYKTKRNIFQRFFALFK